MQRPRIRIPAAPRAVPAALATALAATAAASTIAWKPTLAPLAQPYARAVALADLDRDGDLDIFAASLGAPAAVYLNSLNSTFSPAWTDDVPTSANAVALADFDTDGDIDAVLALDDAPPRVLLNNGDGSFTDHPQPHDFPIRALALDVADVDADGDLDIVFACEGPNILWLNDGAAIFKPRILPGGDDLTTGLDIGDLDADGRLDLFLANPAAPHVILLGVSDPNDPFIDLAIRLPSHTEDAVALADFDHDGDLDALTSARLSRGALWQNDSAANFTRLPDRGAHNLLNIAAPLITADLDHDGDVDLVAPAASEVLLNDGHAAFTVRIPIKDAASAALGDLNTDGDLDLLLASPVAGPEAALFFLLAQPCNCPADLDGDGAVTAEDLAAMLLAWGDCE
ncbi:MAG: VCBS repeat-containing protein [Planctomycetota bacterium]|nr:VCBS repeat-containing protein [Planctomycetota bacterium]